MRATSANLKSDLNTFGFLFESLVVRDLRVYVQPLDGQVFHYRDETGLEVDAVLDTGDRWAAVEIKLGIGQIDQAAANLTDFRRRVDTAKRGEPAFLGIVVGGGLGYVRADGIHVIPIGALRPVGLQPESRRLDRTGDVRNTPNGIRTRAAAVKGRSPRPLDDGGAAPVRAGER